MTLPLLLVAVVATLFAAWLFEFRHREEILPALRHTRHVPPYAAVLLATLFGALVVILPLLSLAEWPRSTQVAWVGAEAADRAAGSVSIGGPEHSALIGWPNGNFLPEVRVERSGDGALRVWTRGGSALVRIGDTYANGELVALGAAGKQIGRFHVELRRRGLLRRRKLLISRTPVAEALVVIDPPPVHATRVRVLDSLLVPRLNDLRREGEIDLATVHALEEWAGSIRILMPESDELRLVQDGEIWRQATIAPGATMEVLWPRRRLGMRVTDEDGAPRLAFEPPWTRTSSLPPFEENASTLSFAREPAMGANTFLLPLGHGAPGFRHAEALEMAQGEPRFRNGANLTPPAPADGPRWLNRVRSGALGAALAPNRALSSVRVPLVVRGDTARGVVLTVMMVRDLPTPRALLIALVCAWLALALFFASIAFSSQRLKLRDLWCIGGIVVAVWSLLMFRVLLATRYLLAPTAVDEVTVKGLGATLAALVIVPGLMTLAVRLWLHHRPGIPENRKSSIVTIGLAVIFAVMAAIELLVMTRLILPNAPERFTASPFDRLLLVVYTMAALVIVAATPLRGTVARVAAWIWHAPYRATFEVGRAFWRALGDEGSKPPPSRGVVQEYAVQPVVRVWNALRSREVRTPFTIWLAGAAGVLVLSRAVEDLRQILVPLWIVVLPALVLLARPLALMENALRVLDGDERTATEPPLRETIATVVLLVFVPLAVMFVVLRDFGAIYMVLALWLPLALLLLLTSAARLASTLLVVIVTGVTVAYWALLGSYAVAPGMTEHILSRVEVMKHGTTSAQEWLLDLEAPSTADARAVTAGNVRNALVHEWEHLALVRKGGWAGLGFNRVPASQSFIRQDTIQYDSVYSFFVSGEHGLVGGVFLLAIYLAPAALLLMRRTSLRTGDLLALAIAAALAGEAVAHAAMNVAQLWFSGTNLPLLTTASNSDVLRWAIMLALLCQALLWPSRLQADSTDTLPETAVTRRSVFDPSFAYAEPRRWKRFAFAAIIAAGAIAAMVTRDLAWLAFACAIPLSIALRTREYAALALLPALLVLVLVVRGSVRAIRSDEYDVLTWSRLLRRIDELHDEGKLQFDPATKTILFRGPDGTLTDRPTGPTLLEAEVLRFNAMPVALRMGGGREMLPPAVLGATTPADYYTRVFGLWQRQSEKQWRTRPPVFTVDRIESESEGTPQITWEIRGNPDYNIVHSFNEDLSEEELQPVAIRGRNGPVQVLGRAWAMGRWVYAASEDAHRLGLGWLHEAGEALLRARRSRGAQSEQLTVEAELQRAVQAAAEEAGREIFGGLLAQQAAAPLPPRVAFTILRATTGETLAMGAWPRATAGDRWRSRVVSDGKRTWRELDPPLGWLGTSAPRALASRHAADHNFTALEMGSAAKPFWATAALVVHPNLHRMLVVRNGTCDSVGEKGRCYERQMFGATMADKGWQVSPTARWVDFSTYLAASDNRYHTRLGLLGLARADGDGIASDGRGPSASGRESLAGNRRPWNRYPGLADSTEHSRDRATRLTNLHQQPLAAWMRDLFGARIGIAPAEGDQRRHLLSFWSGDERDDLQTSRALEPMGAFSPEAVDLQLRGIESTREFVAVILGGASSRWSNISAAAAFSSWAMRRPVVGHIVAREREAVPLPSRARAYEERGADAARKLRTGLRRVIDDGTAIAIRGRLAPLAGRYDIYAKTGTLATVDQDRPTSRILMTIIARDGEGNARNAITLSFVAERASSGFATAALGRFIDRHEAELVRLLEAETGQ